MFSYFDKVKNEKQLKIVKQVRQDIIRQEFETDLVQIVEIDNFPKDLDQQLMKLLNLREGFSGLLKKGNEYFICSCSRIGLPRKDGRPEKVYARYINKGSIHIEEVTNDKEIVLWYNTDFANADYNPLRYSHILAEVDVSILANVKRSRLNPLIRVKDSIEKASIDKALKESDVDYGTPSTYISESTLSELISNSSKDDAILNFTQVNDSDKIQYLSNLNLELRNRFYSKYGLTMNSSGGKMAQQTNAEVKGAESSSWILPLAMLKQAKEFCERCSKAFGLEMSAHFGMIHELNFMSFANDCTNDNTPHGDICEEGAEIEVEELEKEGEQDDDTKGDSDRETEE